MEQMMYMRKTHFRQKYISTVHNFITKARNSSKHDYALCLKKNMTYQSIDLKCTCRHTHTHTYTQTHTRTHAHTHANIHTPILSILAHPISCIVTNGNQGNVRKIAPVSNLHVR